MKIGVSMTSRRCTLLGEGLGTSRPTRASPGTGASILRYGVFSARAMSFSLVNMLWTLTRLRSRADGSASAVSIPIVPRPDSPRLGTQPGTIPNRTILGPAFTSVTSTLTPWSPSVLSTSRAISWRAASGAWWVSGGVSRSTLGVCQPLFLFFTAPVPSSTIAAAGLGPFLGAGSLVLQVGIRPDSGCSQYSTSSCWSSWSSRSSRFPRSISGRTPSWMVVSGSP